MRFEKGYIPWNKGKKCPQISLGLTGNKNPMWGKRGKDHHCFGKHTSEETKRKIGDANRGKTGEKAGNWKGGIRKTGGYIYIFMPDHPFANSRKYVRKSNLVLEKHLGGYLKPGEVAHHKNGIKDDDRIENLQLACSNSEHLKLHRPKEGSFFKSVVN